MRILLLLPLLLFGAPLLAAKARPLNGPQVAAAMDLALQPFVDAGNLAGAVVGVRLNWDEQLRAYGLAGPGLSPSASTIFEIASITKTFTGLLLAQLVTEGKVALEDPVQKYLPSSVLVPKFEGREISLLDLATHTSALPVPGPGDKFLPAWYSFKGMRLISLHLIKWDFENPLLGISEGDFFDAVSRTVLKRAPGARWEYSNIGMGLLGLALARADGVASFGELVQKRVAQPLGMASTWTELPEALASRVAQGHREDGKLAARMNLGPLAAAGGLKSSAQDLLKYLAFQMSQDPAVRFSHQVYRKLAEGDKTRLLPLAWHDDAALGMLYHSGTAGGFHCWIGFLPEKQAGLVLLSNSAAQVVEEIGPELLKQVAGLKFEMPRPLVVVKLEPQILDSYAGTYLLGKQVMTIRRDKDHLELLWDGKKSTALWPRGEGSFFCKEWDCRVAFKPGGADVKMYYNSYWAAKQP